VRCTSVREATRGYAAGLRGTRRASWRNPLRPGQPDVSQLVTWCVPAGWRLRLLGRCDNQVKIRGYRVEIGEIEAAPAGPTRVHDAAVRL